MTIILIQITGMHDLDYIEGQKYKKEIDILSILCAMKKITEIYNIEYVYILGQELFMIEPEKINMLINGLHKFKIKKIIVQSNVTNVNRNMELVKILKKNNVMVNVNYEGYKKIVDELMRINDIYNNFVNGLNILKENKIYNNSIFYIPLQFRNEIFKNREKIYNNIVELDLKNIKINEPWIKGKFEGYGQFVIDCQKYMIDNDIYFQVAPISEIVYGIYGKKNFNLCSWKMNCPNIINIYSDGSIGFCESKDNKFKMFYPECVNCKIYGLCEGGCNRIRSLNNGKYPYCEDRRLIVKYIYENLSLLGQYYGLI